MSLCEWECACVHGSEYVIGLMQKYICFCAEFVCMCVCIYVYLCMSFNVFVCMCTFVHTNMYMYKCG